MKLRLSCHQSPRGEEKVSRTAGLKRTMTEDVLNVTKSLNLQNKKICVNAKQDKPKEIHKRHNNIKLMKTEKKKTNKF